MRTIAKIALWLIGGLAALVTLGVVAVAVVDWNWLRPTVNERASAASGRQVEVRGNLDVDLWSWTPEVVAHDVVFANAPWASEPQMVQIDEVYLRFRLMPIFVGRLEIEHLRLVKPQVALERREGEANWDLGGDTASEAIAEAATPTEREDFPVLEHLEVQEGRISFRSPELSQPIEVTLSSLTVESGGFEDPVRLEAEGTYLDRSFTLQGQGESFERFRSSDEPYDLILDASIGQTQLTAEGSLTAPMQLGGVDARLEVEGENLHELHDLFGLPLPESPAYALSGQLTHQEDRWGLKGFDGTLGESDLSGDLEVATGGDRPRLIADVSSEAFRIEDIESFWGEDEDSEPEETESQHILSDEPIALPKLRRMDAEVKFRGKSVQSGALELRDLAADLTLDNGVLTLTPLKLGLADGRIAADLRLDGRRDVPAMAADVDIEGLDINALLALFGEEDAGAGLLQGRVKISTQGGSMHELGANANGEGALIMSGGRIENILLELIALDLQEAAGQWLTNEEEQVEVLCLAMPTQIESGRFQAQPWILDTTDAIVTVTGFVDLGSGNVNVELEPHPKDFSLFNYLTSIEITGDLSEREVSTSPVEAIGKIVLKAIAAPVMPLLSPAIEESAEERSVPCPSLRERLEASMAQGEDVLPGDDEAEDEGDAEPNPLETAAAPPDAATVRRVQSALNEEGFELAVDGILGPQTEAALRDYQQRHDLEPSGQPSDATLRQLGIAEPEG